MRGNVSAAIPTSSDWLSRQPSWMQERLATYPCAGAGVHRWLFATACRFRRRGCPDDIIADLLTDAVVDCGREVPVREIEGAVCGSASAIDQDPRGEGWRPGVRPRPAAAKPRPVRGFRRFCWSGMRRTGNW